MPENPVFFSSKALSARTAQVNGSIALESEFEPRIFVGRGFSRAVSDLNSGRL